MIVVAGATGNFGFRITTELTKQKAKVRALVRENTPIEKQAMLYELGADVVQVSYDSLSSLSRACEGASVVISALSGLKDVILTAQLQLFNAVVQAGVPRFIPSDFSIDFTKLPEGSNRNLDVRREFFRAIEGNKNIQVTSILNGAFTDMLAGTAPFIMYKAKKVLCWGDRHQQMDWTTMDNTATYTAFAALDSTTPRFLRIAGDQISAQDMAAFMSEVTGQNFKVFRPGGLKLFSAIIRVTKGLTPHSEELYPAWQGMQYMHNMYSGLAKAKTVDNDRYPVQWATAREFVSAHLKTKHS
jgi:hypothetical protein